METGLFSGKSDARFTCFECGRRTRHVCVATAAQRAQVSRATMYAWMERRLVHWLVRPSGRRLVCLPSLTPRPLGAADSNDQPALL